MMLTYRPVKSGIHRLNPFVMLSWLACVLIMSMVSQHPLWLLGILLSTAVIAVRAGVVRQWKAVMKLVLWMAGAIVLINAIAGNQGSHVLLQAAFRLPLVGSPRLTVEALAFGGAMAVRLAAIISAFALLNLCVHPDDLMRAAIKLRLPYRSVLVTSLSVRFIPVLMQDARTIMDVQRSRGLSFDAGGLAQKIRSRGALILPLLANSLDRAVMVAEAMESRGYGTAVQRTYYRETRLTASDILLMITVWTGFVLVLWSHFAGVGAYTYYPSLSSLSLSPTGWLMLGALCTTLCSLAAAGGILPERPND